MRATILAALLLFPALPAMAGSYDHAYGTFVQEQPVGYVIADLRPAREILARSGPRPGESLVPYPAVQPGCAVELKTIYMNGTTERSSRPVCKFVDGTVRPLN